MPYFKVIPCILFLTVLFCMCQSNKYEDIYKWPTIAISILVRNQAHTLPYFLTCLHNLDYPKNRLYIWIYSDYNSDNSITILEHWLNKYGLEYNGVMLIANETTPHLHPDETRSTHWSPGHFRHIIKLREQALNFTRHLWADYIFMLDADAFLTNNATLKLLVKKELQLSAPMLISDGLYSNFWCAMTEYYYYKRTDNYMPMLNRENIDCFKVAMVHTAVLMDMRMRHSDHYTYIPENIPKYIGPEDDIIAFAVNANKLGIPMHICNDEFYGFVPIPVDDNDDPKNNLEQMLNVKLEALGRHMPLPLNDDLKSFVHYPYKWKFGLKEIYMINLERRKDRRRLMEMSFDELGMDVKIINAVDGKTLDMKNLREHSITLMPNYEDPYHKRPMKAGEVGCFLSHYNIWQDMVARNLSMALILEDDIHFVPYFRHRLLRLLSEVELIKWDFMYLGRKALMDKEEESVSVHTVRPLYSYWTLGYVLKKSGAEKLIAAEPLSSMLPVDEFLPIMFDQHPNASWKAHFQKRNLIALSSTPFLVHPTHYTGQEGYISDTEDSDVVTETTLKTEL
ncbi:hypothetical protein ACJJTC_000821 [Scirpophaga incertulas]